MEVGSRLIAIVCLLFISAELLMVSRAEQGVLSQAHSLSLKATTVNCVSQLSTVVSYLKSIDTSVDKALKKAKTTKVKQLLTSAKLELSQAQTWVYQYKFSNAVVNVGKANRNLVTAYSLLKLVEISATLSPIKTINSTLNTLVKYCLPTITPCATPSPAKTPISSTTVNCVSQLSTVESYLKSIDASVNRALKKAKTTKVKQLLTSTKLELTRARIWVTQFRFSNAMVNVGNANRYLSAAYSAEKSFDISATFTPLRTLYSTLNTLVKYCLPTITPCATPSPAQTPTSTPRPIPVSPSKPSPVPVVHPTPSPGPVYHTVPSSVPVSHPTPSLVPVDNPTPSPVPASQSTPSVAPTPR